MKSLWERLDHYNFKLNVRYPRLTIPREGDMFLVNLFYQEGVRGTRLRRLNRCRIHLKTLFLSDLVSANGKSFLAPDETRFGVFPQRHSSFVFPREEPTPEDWSTWYGFWRSFTGAGWALTRSLGRWYRAPHNRWDWVIEDGTNTIWNLTDTTAGYRPILSHVSTRSNRLYGKGGPLECPTDEASLRPVTVSFVDDDVVLLHDIGQPLVKCVDNPPSFWDYLRSQGGEWMWEHVLGDKEDMTWLSNALCNGTVMMVADGSYARDLDPELCATGWIAVCVNTRKQVKGSFFERSLSASAYRGELLGMVALHALIVTVGAVYNLRTHRGSIHCDNLGALGKGRAHGRRVKSSMKQGDLVRALRAMKQGLFHHLKYMYVKSHQDDVRAWQDLPLDQRLNVMCDTLAKQAIGRGLAYTAVNRITHPLSVPFEQASLIVNGNKLTSDVSGPVRFVLGKVEAERFYTRCVDIQDNGVNVGGLGWSSEQFHLVDWESLHLCLNSRPDMFGIWLAKQCIGVCATRRNMARINREDDEVCPNCKAVRERSTHLNVCRDIGRTALFDESVDRVEQWMGQRGRTEPEMAFWLGKILRLRGSTAEIPWHRMSDGVRAVMEDVLTIGWTELLHGKIPISMTEWNSNYIASYRTPQGLTGRSWAKQLIFQILKISHAQWLYRNFTLHHQTRGYLVMKNKLEVLEKLGKLSEARPEEIPEESRFLLEIDFRGLVTSRLDRQVYWIAAMQAAIKAGRDKRFQWKRKGRMPRAAASRTTRAEELSHVRHRKIICSMFAQEVASRKRVCTTQSGTSKYRRTD